MAKKITFKSEIIKYIVLIILIPGIFVSILPGFFIYKNFYQNTIDINNSLKNISSIEISNYFKQVNSNMIVIENSLIKTNKIPSFNPLLNFDSLFENLYSVELISPNGQVIDTLPKNKAIIGYDRNLILENFNSKDSNFYDYGNPNFESKTNHISLPVHKELKGGYHILAYINLNYLSNFIYEISNNLTCNIYLLDSNGTYIAHNDFNLVKQKKTDPNYKNYISKKINLDGSNKVNINGKKMMVSGEIIPDKNWIIIVSKNLKTILTPIINLILFYSLFSLFIFGILTLLILSKINIANTSLKDLIHVTKDVSLGNYKIDFKKQKFYEFESVFNNFSIMIDKIKNKEKEITILNENLEKTIEERTMELSSTLANLKKTQLELIQSEKMASLNNLVISMTHEMTTPIGISKSLLGVIKKDFDSPNDNFKMLEKNLNYLSNLVDNFSKIYIHQNNENLVSFYIKDFLDETKELHKKLLKSKNVDFSYEIKDNLKIKSFKTYFSEILKSLIDNSIVHGFEKYGYNKNKISLFISTDKTFLIIDYFDNGKGIDKSQMPNIFDPFFTTARSKGYTGLGLSIIYNIINSKLMGRILIKDSKEGVYFKILIPLNTIT